MYDDNPTLHDALARNYLALGDMVSARTHAAEAFAMDSSSRRYALQLGELYLTSNMPDSARRLYEYAYSTDSSDLRTLRTLAQIYETTDRDRAIASYEHFLQRSGPDLDTGFRLAQLYAAAGRVTESIALLERLLEANPGHEMLLQALGGMYMRTGSFGRAVEMFEALRDLDPGKPAPQLLLAEALMNAQRWDEASRIFYPLVDSDDLGMEDKMAIGKIYFQHALQDKSTAVEAMQVFTKLREQFPSDWRPAWFTGAVYYNEGALREAINSFEKVVRLSPDNVEALDVLSRAYLGVNDFNGARGTLRSIITLDRANADTWALLGYTCSRTGDVAGAKEAYARALEMDASRMDILSSLALLYDAEGDVDASENLYERALQWYGERSKDQTYYQLLNNYAYALCEHGGDLDRALELAREAVEHDLENSSYLDTIGWIYYRMEQHATALTYVRRAVEIRLAASRSPGAVLYEHLGDIHMGLGNTDAAVRSWQQALAADPDNQTLIQKLEHARND
jgi:tetratricopeptide (TPR) repeat protein